MEENIIENGIKLQDGRVIQGYPKQDVISTEETLSTPMLDATDKYFSIKHKPSKSKPTQEEELIPRKLFTDNAFLILANRERILSDSRMMLTPVCVRNGLAYSGAFQTATLGVYIEWWLNAPYSVLFDENDEMSLIWFVSGSPLSGGNLCSKVAENGVTDTVRVPFFRELWPKFADIIADYHESKRLYQAYTLPEVIEILKRETTAENYAESIDRFHYQAKVALLNAELCSWKDRYKREVEECNEYQHKWHLALIQSRLDKVEVFYKNYIRKKEIMSTRIEELTKENHKLKKDLRSGLLTNKQYQPMLRKNKQEIEGMKHNIHTFKTEGLVSLFPEIAVRFGETYLINHKEEKILDEIIEWFGSNTKP